MKTIAGLTARNAEIRKALDTLNAEIGDAQSTPEQDIQWTDLTEESARNTEQISVLQRAENVAESRKRWGAPAFVPDGNDLPAIDARSAKPGQVIERAERLLDDKSEGARHLDAEERSALEKLIRKDTGDMAGHKLARMMVATETPAYRNAFRKLIGRGGNAYLSAEEGAALETVEELRTAMSLSDSNGGLAVPVLIDPTVVLTAQGTPNDFFDISRVEQITNDEWRGISSAGATWYWTTEGVASTDGAPTIAQPTVPTKKITGWIPYSIEIGGDWPGFAAEMSRVLREGYNEKVVEALTNGLGTTAQPTGIVTALEANAAVQILVSTDGSLYAADIYKIWKTLPAKYRRTASWMMSTGVENAVRQFGGAAGDPNFTANLTQAGIPGLFNRPVYENDYMDDVSTVTASDSSLVILGDFRNFLIAQRVGMTVELVQHVQSSGVPTGQRGLYAYARLGSDSINDNGFRMLTND